MDNRILKFKLELSEIKYIQMYIDILNVFLPKKLTGKEVEVIATFLSLSEGIIEKDMFNSYARNLVKEKMGLSAAGLSNYLKSLVEKGFLIKDGDKLKIKDYLNPNSKELVFNINIINKGKDE